MEVGVLFVCKKGLKDVENNLIYWRGGGGGGCLPSYQRSCVLKEDREGYGCFTQVKSLLFSRPFVVQITPITSTVFVEGFQSLDTKHTRTYWSTLGFLRDRTR